MNDRLGSHPPLNALRAFEAAARHLSFTKAADELCVTQGAVSRHIKALEEHFGVSLFDRTHRTLSLTAEGQALLPGLTHGFTHIRESVESLKEQGGTLSIKALPSVAVRWLIPHLGAFQAANPDIEVNLTTAWMGFSATRDTFDAGIRYASHWCPLPESNSVESVLIYEEWLTPVCSPGYLEKAPPLKGPRDLARHTILNFRCNVPDKYINVQDDWQLWLKLMGYNDVRLSIVHSFDTIDTALNTAINDQGIALGDIRLIQNDLNAGRLVMPLDVRPQKLGGYYLVYRKRARQHPHLELFRDWLIAEGRQPLPQVPR